MFAGGEVHTGGELVAEGKGLIAARHSGGDAWKTVGAQRCKRGKDARRECGLDLEWCKGEIESVRVCESKGGRKKISMSTPFVGNNCLQRKNPR